MGREVYLVCMNCWQYSYVDAAWVGYYLGDGPIWKDQPE